VRAGSRYLVIFATDFTRNYTQTTILSKPDLPPLAPGDYYFNEQGLLVFTREYHLKRGYCCKNGCKHCPYGYPKPAQQDKKY
jgi:hypothetical protein